MSTSVHESAHAVVALLLGKRVHYIERDPGHTFVGEKAGFASIDLGEGIDRERLMIALAGYLAGGGRLDWPPDWDGAFEEELEALNLIMPTLALKPEEYDALVQETRRLLQREDVRRLIAALARVLDRVPRVWEPEILSIAKAVGIHPETKGVLPCST